MGEAEVKMREAEVKIGEELPKMGSASLGCAMQAVVPWSFWGRSSWPVEGQGGQGAATSVSGGVVGRVTLQHAAVARGGVCRASGRARFSCEVVAD